MCVRNVKAWPTPRVKKKVVSAKEAKIKIFTISFDVLSIEKCILCDKAAKQQNRNCGLLPAAAQIKDLLLRFFYSTIREKFRLPAEGRRRQRRHARATPPSRGDVYEEGPLIRVFRSVSLTLTDGGQA